MGKLVIKLKHSKKEINMIRTILMIIGAIVVIGFIISLL